MRATLRGAAHAGTSKSTSRVSASSAATVPWSGWTVHTRRCAPSQKSWLLAVAAGPCGGASTVTTSERLAIEPKGSRACTVAR